MTNKFDYANTITFEIPSDDNTNKGGKNRWSATNKSSRSEQQAQRSTRAGLFIPGNHINQVHAVGVTRTTAVA